MRVSLSNLDEPNFGCLRRQMPRIKIALHTPLVRLRCGRAFILQTIADFLIHGSLAASTSTFDR